MNINKLIDKYLNENITKPVIMKIIKKYNGKFKHAFQYTDTIYQWRFSTFYISKFKDYDDIHTEYHIYIEKEGRGKNTTLNLTIYLGSKAVVSQKQVSDEKDITKIIDDTMKKYKDNGQLENLKAYDSW